MTNPEVSTFWQENFTYANKGYVELMEKLTAWEWKIRQVPTLQLVAPEGSGAFFTVMQIF